VKLKDNVKDLAIKLKIGIWLIQKNLVLGLVQSGLFNRPTP
jgi:hypothetical protein